MGKRTNTILPVRILYAGKSHAAGKRSAT
jgi:hypothetical protein